MPIVEEQKVSSLLKKELEVSRSKISFLEKENHDLRQEIDRLRAQVNTFRAHDLERKSILWKKLQNYSVDAKLPPERSRHKPTLSLELPEQNSLLELDPNPKEDFLKSAAKEERVSKSLKLPPRLITPDQKVENENKLPSSPAPPPPPPLPSKLLCRSKALRRMPEVMEFYRSLMKKDAQKESKANSTRNLPVLNPRNMIGEIENRSSYLLNIKSDVEIHGELVNSLAKEVEAAAFADISEVELFLKRLDGELSCLVDERAVLKHFPQWPERKADALREAACSNKELRSLQSEVSSYKDNPKQQLSESLRKLQALQDRLEKSVNNIERMREGMSKKYRELHIPWAWMMDAGVIGELKFGSVSLAKQYMKRVSRELQSSEAVQEEDLLLQGVRFAYRVHQFAGGFDTDAMQAFEELRRVGCQKHLGFRLNELGETF